MNEDTKDLVGFFGTLGVLAANPADIRGVIWRALAAAWKTGDRSYGAFREKLGEFLAPKIAALFIVTAAALGFFLWAGEGVLAWGPGTPEGFDNWSKALLPATVCFMVALVLQAALVAYLGKKAPRQVPFFMSAIVLAFGLWVPVAWFFIHAARTGNGWLLFVASCFAGFALVVSYAAASIIGWVLRKSITFFEKTLELAAVTGVPLPGVTTKNYKEVFKPLIDLLNEDAWGSKPKKAVANLGAAIATYVILLSYDISVKWALAMSPVFVAFAAYGLVISLQDGLAEKVLERRKKFLWGFYGFGILILALRMLCEYWEPAGNAHAWFQAFMRGDVILAKGTRNWIIFGVSVGGFFAARSALKKGFKTGAAAIVGAGVLVLVVMFSGGKKPGETTKMTANTPVVTEQQTEQLAASQATGLSAGPLPPKSIATTTEVPKKAGAPSPKRAQAKRPEAEPDDATVDSDFDKVATSRGVP